jgi:hypothetical protein
MGPSLTFDNDSCFTGEAPRFCGKQSSHWLKWRHIKITIGMFVAKLSVLSLSNKNKPVILIYKPQST